MLCKTTVANFLSMTTVRPNPFATNFRSARKHLNRRLVDFTNNVVSASRIPGSNCSITANGLPVRSKSEHLLHHSITPSLHHSITPSLHHSITPSLHHSIDDHRTRASDARKMK